METLIAPLTILTLFTMFFIKTIATDGIKEALKFLAFLLIVFGSLFGIIIFWAWVLTGDIAWLIQ